MYSCPATDLQPPQALTTAFKQQNLGMNNMVKFMLKRGLVNDLARIPHCLDMSSPLMAFTVNAALKPLEALSRIVNLPPAALLHPWLDVRQLSPNLVMKANNKSLQLNFRAIARPTTRALRYLTFSISFRNFSDFDLIFNDCIIRQWKSVVH